MSAEALLREGRLDEALASLQQEVRTHPADPKRRVFLFQLLCVLGQWQRALNQLQVAGGMDPSTLAMVQTYREALRCEALRAEVFAGRRAPMLFGEPEAWIALLLEALRLTAAGEFTAAAEARGRAFEGAPASPGTIDGTAFEWFADADVRLGPVIEAIVNGRYFWVPVHRIREMRLEAPVDLRDVVWTPAYFTWRNGGEVPALIPTRYPGSETSVDPRVRLARITEWQECPGDLALGLGQRLLATDVAEYPIMDTRAVIFAGEAVEGEGAAAAAGSPHG